AVALSPGGKTALTGTFGGKAQVWDVTTGQRRGAALEHPEQVSAVAFVPRRGAVLTGCGDNTARQWDAKTGKLLDGPLRHRPADGIVWSLALSPDGERLLTGGDDGTTCMWDLGTGTRVGQALAHQDEVRAVAFSSDGGLFATAGYDRVARVWQAAPRPF